MADGYETAVRLQARELARAGVAKLERHQPLRLAAADELDHFLVPQHFDVGMREQAILEIFSARRLSRRWIRVTSWLWLVI
jgi:hypothetical protein